MIQEDSFGSNQQSVGLDDYFIQKKVELMMDMNNKKISEELKNLHSMIAQLTTQVSEIKRGLNENRFSAVREQPVEHKTVKSEEQKELIEKPKKNDEAPKPRYGDYKSDDVSINKFFYFGNKKQN